MWLITGQLASGTYANHGRGWECRQLKWGVSTTLLMILLWNCFNDFPTSCFIFMSSVLSVNCRRLPASKNDQLCMPLNMYICAFVYSIGVHWYFFFSSLWFTKKIMEAPFPYLQKTLLSFESVDENDPQMTSCVTSLQIPSLPQPVSQSIPSASSYQAYRDTSSGTSEYLNPFTVKPSGRCTADWWSCITRWTDTEKRHLVEILHPEREGVGEKERAESKCWLGTDA